VRHAALKALAPEVARRLAAIAEADDADFALEHGAIRHAGARVARVSPGAALLRPRIDLIGGAEAGQLPRRRAEARLGAWLADEIARELWPLCALEAAGRDCVLSGAARGLAYRLFESGGAVDRREHPTPNRADRAALAALGVRFGRHTIYAPALTRPRALRLLTTLRERCFRAPRKAMAAPLAAPFTWADYAAAGFRPLGRRAVRIDAIERLAAAARRAAGRGRDFALDARWSRLIGGDADDLRAALRALGYRRAAARGEETRERWRFPALRAPAASGGGGERTPFTALADLLEARRRSGT
jgi:ATP-dependent RNA helicase SUPV3L1/SUV3